VNDNCHVCGQQLGFLEVDGKKEFYCNTCKLNPPPPVITDNESKIKLNLQNGIASNLEHVQLYAGKDCGIIFLDELFSAKYSLRICSPWISKNYLEKLISLSNNSVQIFLITSKDQYGYNIIELLDKEQTKHKINHKFTPSREVHSKIYVIDDGFSIIGSANLTESGLDREQDNHVAYTKDGNDVKKCSIIFDDLFKKL
jgi:phosphatidylserine/phosphatidylglycerophosphate/cardiolipin synthase-like enzyme